MNPDALVGLAANHLRQANPREAERLLRLALSDSSNHLEAHFLLGMILCRTGRWQESVTSLQLVVQNRPGRDQALYWLALAQKNLGEPDVAAHLLRQALKVNAANPIVLNELGVCCLMSGEAAEAEKALQRACELEPRSGTYFFNLGMALSRLDRIYKALEAFREAARLEPGRIESFMEMASILEILNRREEVLRVLTEAQEHHPDSPEVLLAVAAATSALGNKERAEEIYRSVAAEHPALSGSFGLWLQKEGRFAESASTFINALTADPEQGLPYFGLAEAKVFEIGGEPWHRRAEMVLESEQLDLKGKTYLAYALARSAEKRGSQETAMRFFDLANHSAYQLYNAGRPFDRTLIRKITDETIATFSKQALRDPIKGSSTSNQPIFIVGMIRSGTTLLDQILSSHRDVQSAGEPVFWLREADKVRRHPRDYDSLKAISELAENYLLGLAEVAGGASRITDKMPLNYSHIGLIHQIFPNAKIIHMRRQPLDTCFSVYTTFLGLGPIFSYHQGNIVFSYLEYLRLMEHWRQVLPQQSYVEVDYETLISDREPTVRKLLEFCDLDWDEACLHHDRNEAAIKTPSKWQARQPVYATSIERWRPYEPWLGDLLNLKGLSHPPSG